MKDSETFIECCEKCSVYPCSSLMNLDKCYGNQVYKWAKRVTRQVGCIVNKELVDKKQVKK